MGELNLVDRRVESNRLNALRSTGPRTPAGRVRSSLNAVKHGLAAARVLLPGEDQAEFDALRDEAIESFQPQNFVEALLGERITLAYWRLRRVARAEKDTIEDGILADAVDRARREVALDTKGFLSMLRAVTDHEVKPDEAEAQAARLEAALKAQAASQTTTGSVFARAEKAGLLAAIERHERGIENALYKALHEFARVRMAQEPPVALDLTVTGVEESGRCACRETDPPLEGSDSGSPLLG